MHNSLAARYIEAPSGDFAACVEAAVAHASMAVAASADGSALQANAYANLGMALLNRVKGDRALGLEKAIDALSTASSQFADLGLNDKRAMVDTPLGQALVERVEGRHSDNVEKALGYIQSAANTLIESGSPNAAVSLVALGNMYALRPSGGTEDNLKKAIETYERGISLPGVLPYHLGLLHNNAGIAYRDLARNKFGPIAPAIQHYQIALQLAGLATPLSSAEVLENLAWALDFRQESGDADQATAMLAAAADEFAQSGSARHQRRTLRELGDMLFARKEWQAAADAFTRAAEVDVPLFSAAESPTGRRNEIGATGRMHTRWAYTFLQMGRPADALSRSSVVARECCGWHAP